MIDPILTHPHETLSRVADPVDFDKESFDELKAITNRMASTLMDVKYGGKLGIAAPQIGISKRIMLVRGAVMINPEWKPSRAPLKTIVEGCYSVPHRRFKVERAEYGWAKWYNLEGKMHEAKLKGMEAIVFQHELSHLDGQCCIDLGIEIEEPTST